MTRFSRLHSLIGLCCLLLASGSSHAGSQFYLGLDAARHTLDTETTTTYSAIEPTSFGEARDTYGNWGIRAGYKFKSRLTDRHFWAPELAVMTFDDDDYLYGTHLRLGYEMAPLEVYTSLGVSRIEKFTDNRLSYGLGLEYRLTNHASFSAEWTRYDPIEESTRSTVFIGLTEVDIQTRTERSLDTIRIGFTYYFQGSI